MNGNKGPMKKNEGNLKGPMKKNEGNQLIFKGMMKEHPGN